MNKKQELQQSLTEEEALALVPEYILLRSGQEADQNTDEYLCPHSGVTEWESCIGYEDWEPPVVATKIDFFRRGIPDDVRRAMAVIALYEANQFREYPVPAIAQAVAVVGKWLLQGGRND